MKRWMLYFLGIVMLLISGYFIWNNEDGKTREEKIIQEYQAIKHPQGAKMVSYELNRKIIKRWIHSRYYYTISNNQVHQYYEQELLGNGWRQTPYSLRPGDIGYLYKKNNLELALTLNKDNTWTLSMHFSDAKY